MSGSDVKMTPMMRQYLEWKNKYPDCLLLFRMGDFYETFFDDTRTVSRELDLTLTARDGDKKLPMAGVPYHAVDGYLARLIEKGYRVAICEQMSEPDGRTLVDREVIRVVTPGTWLPEDASLNASLAAVLPGKETWAAAFLAPSSPHVRVALAGPDEILGLITGEAPRELLVPASSCPPALRGGSWSVLELPKSEFSPTSGQSRLAARWGLRDLAPFGLPENDPRIGAAAAAVSYMEETSFSKISHLQGIVCLTSESYLHLDQSAQMNLELLNGGASLFAFLNRCRTTAGRRLLQDWIVRPLRDERAVNRRLDAVEALLAAQNRRDLEEGLACCRDLERSVARLHLGTGGPRDLAAIRDTLSVYPAVFESAAPVRDLVGLPDPALTGELASRLASSLVQSVPRTIGATPLVASGVDEELDSWRSLNDGGQEWLDAYLEKERAATGVSKLKVGYNRVFGFYLELSKGAAAEAKLPDRFERRQTLVNGERFITPELKEYEDRRLSAESHIKDIENRIFDELCQAVMDATAALQQTGQALARLDVLASFADVASVGQYCRPVFSPDRLEIRAGRHPVVEASLRGVPYVPNDLTMDRTRRVGLVTGPNMAGKSTYLRAAAIIQIMAQMGAFVPAEKASLPLVDRLFTRIGARDELSRGNSTFMVEMIETAAILNNATSDSLVILDEVGRGTSTYDGMSIAWAALEYLHGQGGFRPWVLFATHYHELTRLEETLDGLFNLSMAVSEADGEVRFLHHVQEGPADRSYGVEVARLAGLPRVVVRRASELLEKLEGDAPKGRSEAMKPSIQMELFDLEGDRLIDRLSALRPDDMTPKEALDCLYRLTDEARKLRMTP